MRAKPAGDRAAGSTANATVAATAEVALSEKLDVPTGNLSGGQKRKLSLAIAFITKPNVVFLDEPTSGLDPNQIVEVRNLIERLGEEHTVVLSTHYLQEVEKSCTRVVIVNHGEIVADGNSGDDARAAEPAVARRPNARERRERRKAEDAAGAVVAAATASKKQKLGPSEIFRAHNEFERWLGRLTKT